MPVFKAIMKKRVWTWCLVWTDTQEEAERNTLESPIDENMQWIDDGAGVEISSCVPTDLSFIFE
jgi:hypothetical protein